MFTNAIQFNLNLWSKVLDIINLMGSNLAQLSTFCTKMSVCFRGQVGQFYDNYDNYLAVDLTIKVGPLYRH